MTNTSIDPPGFLSPALLIAAAAIAVGLLAPPCASARPARAPGESSASPPAEGSGTPPSEAGSPAAPESSATAPPTESSTVPSGTPRSHANASRSCHLSVEATSHRITAGESVTLYGALLCPSGMSTTDQPVTLYQHQRAVGVTGFSILDTASTEADGSYQLTATVSTNSVFYVSSVGARSTRTVVKVAPAITFSGSAPNGAKLFVGGHRLRPGAQAAIAQGTVTFTGTINPADEGAVVALQRENATANEEWHRIDLAHVDENGDYSITHTFKVPGEARVRVIVHNRGHNVASASEPLSYEISQRQNPQLTVQASADPISYGQSVTISGVAAGAPHQRVTLLARTRGSGPVVMGKAATDGSGKYTFTESPSQRTFYKVTTAATTSAVLFEGVKHVLSTEPPPTTVQAGAPLSFSGTVTPAQVGEMVYLQRQDASGIGFHIIDVGTVSAAATYTIVHTFGVAGAAALRIMVPGDNETQGIAGPLFKVDVTPAPAAALGAEAPAEALPEQG